MLKKKLIEVALPLEAINAASAREKSIRHGHPSTLHLWWARRPLAAARAVIFAQMVDDPSGYPDLFPTEKAQEKERQRLFRIIEELVKWENTTNETVLQQARDEIWRSWRRTCAENADHPRAKELFDRHQLPAFHDPFAGGGALPLEAQRLGLEAYASDLNPVAVLINRAMIEIPPRFAGSPPVNPKARAEKSLLAKEWKGAQGLAEDVRYYGKWMRDEAEKRIGHLYPRVEVTAQMAADRPDLKPYVGRQLTVIAWLWARTVRCPNPACGHQMPMIRSFWLSTKPARPVYFDPVVHRAEGRVRFAISSTGHPRKETTNASAAECLFCGRPLRKPELREQASNYGMGVVPLVVVCEGENRRLYLPAEASVAPTVPEVDPHTANQGITNDRRWFSPPLYGLPRYRDLFTPRQLATLTTLSTLVEFARAEVLDAARRAGFGGDDLPLDEGGAGALAYADSVATYLALAVSRTANYCSTVCSWHSGAKYETVTSTFGRQAIPMTFDYAEANPFSGASGNWSSGIEWVANVISGLPANPRGTAVQSDAVQQFQSVDKVVSTDPPYYDNIGYADLSEFFYIWLRRALKPIFPDLFATMEVPKAEELVASPFRHGTKETAEAFFLDGMTRALGRLGGQGHPAFPMTIYYAFKQSENAGDEGNVGTGWESFLEALIRAGFEVRGTWPIRTEYIGNLKKNVSALASSIVLVCRPRASDAPTSTRREFVAALRRELPEGLRHLQAGNVAPVDLAQAAIGPGMGVYTRYSRVLDAAGNPMKVREALALINQTLDEAMSEQEGDFDPDSRWALAWFEQYGFSEGDYGVAETLSKAKNTGVDGLRRSGIVESRRGKVRLLKPEELPAGWDPENDTRLNAWEMVHHLIRAFEQGGEGAAAEIVRRLGSRAEVARELAYRLYTLCERKKRAPDALAYNGLVQSWPEIARRAAEEQPGAQASLDL
jgi:putative DNA methylase